MGATKAEWGVQDVTLQGYIGKRIDGCFEKRVMAQNADELIETFTHPRDVHGAWASEFWGKWVQGAMAYYNYNHDQALYDKIKDSAEKIIATQQENGYIGDYDTKHQLANWDVWGRKYTLLGLIKWYRLSGDKKTLNAARRLLDYTMTQIGPDGKHIWQTGLYRGMPPSSILEPVMFIYNETKDERYLDFAKFIVADNESEGGSKLIAKCNIPVAERFVLDKGSEWWSFNNGQKGYEMMSCYIGLLELYKVTQQAEYLAAAETVFGHIVNEEINITGGACSFECFYGGHDRQTHPAIHTMETCVTFTWMQFAERLLEITGKSCYVDQIERTMYNALMSSIKYDNSQIVKYVPLEGFRREGEQQCGVNINCCNANAPRAFAMIPRVAYRMPDKDRIDVNLFIAGNATMKMGKRQLTLTQETDYPRTDEVLIKVSPDKKMTATIALRIPSWSANTLVEVNGEPIEGVRNGDYCLLNREWLQGDEIHIRLDMQAHLIHLDQMAAIERGPIVFARDTRFADGFVDETVTIPNKDGVVALTPAEPVEGIWMSFTTPMIRGTYASSETDTRQIHLCDFASAGNTWDESVRYRVWLPILYNPAASKR